MEELNSLRQYQTIAVPASTFNERLDELIRAGLSQNQPGSVYSRLALIHQVAKVFATESVIESGITLKDVTIDELTDPPLYEPTPDDEPVIIQFSFR